MTQRSIRRTIEYLKGKGGVNTTLPTIKTYLEKGKPYKGYIIIWL